MTDHELSISRLRAGAHCCAGDVHVQHCQEGALQRRCRRGSMEKGLYDVDQPIPDRTPNSMIVAR